MMIDASAGKFVDRTSIATFGVSVLTILAITSTVRRVAGISQLAVPAALSLGLSFALGYKELYDALGWFVVIGNGCLLFLAVVGANEYAAPRPAGTGERQGRGPKRFFGSFFR